MSINGVSSLYTSYLIDGLDNNERFLEGRLSLLICKDVTVLTTFQLNMV
jgi:hypothetical protein